MPRGYRCIVVVAFGCMFAAASLPQDRTKAEPNERRQLAEQAKKNIATVVQNSIQVPGEITPCDQGHYDRRNDLCAQWESVDAAEETAKWTRRTFWLTLLGSIGILSALFISARANRVAVQAERPHVRLYRTIKKKSWRGNVISVQGVSFRNYGRTPARIASLSIKFALKNSPPSPKKDKENDKIWPADSVMPQDEEWPRKYHIGPMAGEATIDDLIPRHGKDGFRLFVYGEIRYFDAFNKEHVSGFCRQWNGRDFTYNQTDIGGDKTLNYAT